MRVVQKVKSRSQKEETYPKILFRQYTATSYNT